MRAHVALVLGAALLIASSDTASAQHVYQRVSFNYVSDSSGRRPGGPYSDPAALAAAVDSANVFLDRMGRGYRLRFSEATDIFGASEYYVLSQSEFDSTLQEDAIANPVQFNWRTDAINVYVVNAAFTGGAARVPSYLGPDNDVMHFVSQQDPFYWDQLLIHEIGHHNALWHTHETNGSGFTGPCPGDDCVADTYFDPSISCDALFSCTVAVPPEPMFECCCTTKLQLLQAAATAGGWTPEEFQDMRFNVMSYFGAVDCTDMGVPVTFRNMRMTQGQADRWADATRRYHVGEVTGFTFFVDENSTAPSPDGYSDNAYKTVETGVAAAAAAGATHIVNVRSGIYEENITINVPVTVRANRGQVTIGS